VELAQNQNRLFWTWSVRQHGNRHSAGRLNMNQSSVPDSCKHQPSRIPDLTEPSIARPKTDSGMQSGLPALSRIARRRAVKR
jgi:hypothetical protein